MPFFQDGPTLGNQYQEDDLLRSLLARRLPQAVLEEISPDLERFGQRVQADIAAWGADAEARQPQLVHYDPWGRRIDRIDVSEGWRQLDRVSAEEGLVAIGYERNQGAYSRLYQLAKLYLFNPSSATYMCPLAMTDGAARLIEVYGDATLREGAYQRLTSRDPHYFWTSGQWMTERPGGSDVGRSETVARPVGDGRYKLYGDKWFTSATTSQMAMTLARIEDADGRVTEGSRGLSVFYLEMRRPDGSYNGIRVNRLKDKLGTKALPTAELSLDGAEAVLIGEPGAGVRTIATLFNVTRIYNAFAAVSGMRRGYALARDYAERRAAFGAPLIKLPLHAEVLSRLYVDLAAGLELSCEAALLQGKVETGAAEAGDDARLRMLTPLIKLFTAKLAVGGASEVLEAFGGAGYVEDTGIPQLLRDAQVLSIWEGTTNVLSLDMLRAMQREAAFGPLMERLRAGLAAIDLPELADAKAQIEAAVERIEAFGPTMLAQGAEFAQAAGRNFAYGLARTYAALLLAERAAWAAGGPRAAKDFALLKRWLQQDLTPLIHPDAAWRGETDLLLDVQVPQRA